MIIRAQDDVTEDGLKLKISIPRVIQDGPIGDGLEVIIDRNQKATKDNDGNFLNYNIDQKGNIAPHLWVEKLYSQAGFWPPNSASVRVAHPGGRQEFLSLLLQQDSKGILFAKYGNFTYDIPSHINPYNLLYPFSLDSRDSEGKPLYSHSVDQMPFFDAVSTFGTVWTVFDMYGKDIKDLGDVDVQSKWDRREKVKIFPHMTEEQFRHLYPTLQYEKFLGNAFYDYRAQDRNGKHVICFFPIDSVSENYTSQSLSIGFHESGHNGLNILRPDLWQSSLHDVRAFHETFGDMTALFATLRLPELRRRVLESTGGNLHNSSFLSVIGKKIVDRDATQCTTLSVLPSCEEHDLSERLTRALYGTFADFFNTTRGDILEVEGLDSLLETAANEFRLVFLRTTLYSELTSFSDFGKSLRSESGQGQLLPCLVHINFLRQGIDLTNPLLAPQMCSLQKTQNDEPKSIGCFTGKIQTLTTSREKDSDSLSKYFSSFSLNPRVVRRN